MRKRKLQVFLSSTYQDLVDYRLAAIEAILASGHIPAAMEQFSPGDETAWEKIRTWIDESDAFILMLGGRYGSIEPVSGKSYIHLEYEYAVQTKKPLFAMVVSPAHHERRVRELGLVVDERENPHKYGAFKELVTQKLCAFWEDKKDIKATIFQKLPEWAQRADLVGWVRGSEAANAEAINELARLSQENRELRAKVGTESESFEGFSFEELARLLKDHQIDPGRLQNLKFSLRSGPPSYGAIEIGDEESIRDLCDLFYSLHRSLASGVLGEGNNAINELAALASFGLIDADGSIFQLTELGRRFKNRLLLERSQRAAAPSV